MNTIESLRPCDLVSRRDRRFFISGKGRGGRTAPTAAARVSISKRSIEIRETGRNRPKAQKRGRSRWSLLLLHTKKGGEGLGRKAAVGAVARLLSLLSNGGRTWCGGGVVLEEPRAGWIFRLGCLVSSAALPAYLPLSFYGGPISFRDRGCCCCCCYCCCCRRRRVLPGSFELRCRVVASVAVSAATNRK
jgi:hypothetical protein